MIESVTGDLLLADAEALVDTVNCAGVMGRGLVAQFKQAFPQTSWLTRSPASAARSARARCSSTKPARRATLVGSSTFPPNATFGAGACSKTSTVAWPPSSGSEGAVAELDDVRVLLFEP